MRIWGFRKIVLFSRAHKCAKRGSRANMQIVMRIFDFRRSAAVQFSGAVITNSAIRDCNSARRGNFAFSASTCP